MDSRPAGLSVQQLKGVKGQGQGQGNRGWLKRSSPMCRLWSVSPVISTHIRSRWLEMEMASDVTYHRLSIGLRDRDKASQGLGHELVRR